MKLRSEILALAVVFLSITGRSEDLSTNARGRQFIGFDSFDGFTTTAGPAPGQMVLTSPEISSRIRFTEVVVSWNAGLSTDAFLVVEARAVYPGRATKYYNLGTWTRDLAPHPRQSEPGQKDTDGDVATDVLKLMLPAKGL
ncbi:MAG: hypothetical protein ACREIC_17435, partial [Limisphaerales bacterium]